MKIKVRIERERIWEVLAANYKIELPDFMAERLAEKFAISGRSVKNVLKLAGFHLKRKPGLLTEALVEKLLRFQDHEAGKQ